MQNGHSTLSAVLLAVLVMIILLASVTSVFLLTDRNDVKSSKTAAAAIDSSVEDESAESSEESSNTDSSEAENVSAAKFPVEDAGYKKISDKDFTAANAILVDVDNNTIIAGKDYDKKVYPASLTKIMTLLVAVENIENLDDTYTFTNDDIDPLVEENASRAGFEAGEKVTANDLLYASILVSGADGTLGLSNLAAGSEKAFVELMNQKAEQLGLKNTHFTNASGLHDKNHYSTPEDIAVILKTAMENETCAKVLTAKTYISSKTKQNKDGIKMSSIVFNRLKDYYVEGGGEITGGKTGFISESKYSLATTYEHDDSNYICVTSKSTTEWTSVEDTILLYEKYTKKSASKSEGSKAEAESKSFDESSASVREHI